MAKRLKGDPDDTQLAQGILNSAHQIWLAGLAAFAKTQEEGGKFFDSLVKEGEKIEARSRKAAEGRIEEVRNKTVDTWERLEQVFEDRVSRSLNRLGVPTHEDLKAISKQMEELNKSIKELARREKQETRPRVSDTPPNAPTPPNAKTPPSPE